MRKHHTIGGPYMDRARATSHYRKYGNTRFGQTNDKDDEADKKDEDQTNEKTKEDAQDEAQEDCEDGEECPKSNDQNPDEKAEDKEKDYENPYAEDYWELFLLGSIDGFASNFNVDCRNGLSSTVSSLFDVFDNLGIYDPRLIGKFSISNVNFTEATNSVYAHCDMSQLVDQFTKLADYQNYEQYIVFASRVGGVFINEYWEKSACIEHGNKIDNGYDVGFCSFQLVSAILDTEL